MAVCLMLRLPCDVTNTVRGQQESPSKTTLPQYDPAVRIQTFTMVLRLIEEVLSLSRKQARSGRCQSTIRKHIRLRQ